MVSVITPIHNDWKNILKVVESVAGQTVKVKEHIIINDGSTDGVEELISSLQEKFPHLIYLEQERKGPGPARNYGINMARGRYIAFLDSDDWWFPEKLENQIGFMESNCVLFSYGDYVKRDSLKGGRIATYIPPYSLGYKQLLKGCPIGCLTVAYNQEVLGKRYMSEKFRGQDWGLWLELTQEGVIAKKYPGNFAVYEDSPNSVSSRKLKKCVDIFRIYRTEQKFNFMLSIYYLGIHIFSSAQNKIRLYR